MKIGKILLWGAGIGTAIWAAKKILFTTSAKPNPETGENIPPRTISSGVKDETANFTGKSPRPVVKNNQFVCPAGWKWSNAERKCVPGGFGAFNGEFPGETNNEDFDLMTGDHRIKIKTPLGVAQPSTAKIIVIKKSQNGTPIKWKDEKGNVYSSKLIPTKKNNNGTPIEWKDSKGNTWVK